MESQRAHLCQDGLATLYTIDSKVRNLGEDAVYTRVSESELEKCQEKQNQDGRKWIQFKDKSCVTESGWALENKHQK